MFCPLKIMMFVTVLSRFFAQVNTGTMDANALEAPLASAGCSSLEDDGFGGPMLGPIDRDEESTTDAPVCVGLNFSTFNPTGSDLNAYVC